MPGKSDNEISSERASLQCQETCELWPMLIQPHYTFISTLSRTRNLVSGYSTGCTSSSRRVYSHHSLWTLRKPEYTSNVVQEMVIYVYICYTSLHNILLNALHIYAVHAALGFKSWSVITLSIPTFISLRQMVRPLLSSSSRTTR